MGEEFTGHWLDEAFMEILRTLLEGLEILLSNALTPALASTPLDFRRSRPPAARSSFPAQP